MKAENVINRLGDAAEPPLRAYSVSPAGGTPLDCPELGESPLFLFTMAYSELIDAIADTLFPPNQVVDRKGAPHLLKASEARIDRHVHFRAAWQPSFGSRVQLALRDLTQACLSRFGDRHFAIATDAERAEILTELQKGALPPAEWAIARAQKEAFSTIYEAVSCGLLADPGYGGNLNATGWFYTGFMTIEGK